MPNRVKIPWRPVGGAMLLMALWAPFLPPAGAEEEDAPALVDAVLPLDVLAVVEGIEETVEATRTDGGTNGSLEVLEVEAVRQHVRLRVRAREKVDLEVFATALRNDDAVRALLREGREIHAREPEAAGASWTQEYHVPLAAPDTAVRLAATEVIPYALVRDGAQSSGGRLAYASAVRSGPTAGFLGREFGIEGVNREGLARILRLVCEQPGHVVTRLSWRLTDEDGTVLRDVVIGAAAPSSLGAER